MQNCDEERERFKEKKDDQETKMIEQTSAKAPTEATKTLKETTQMDMVSQSKAQKDSPKEIEDLNDCEIMKSNESQESKSASAANVEYESKKEKQMPDQEVEV